MDKKTPGTVSEFLDRFTEFLIDSEGESIEDLEEDLRVEGINPEEVVQQLQSFVGVKLDEYRLAWREQARQERAAMLERLRKVPVEGEKKA